ncbi:cell division protein FtsK, partial [Streptomyces oceani]
GGGAGGAGRPGGTVNRPPGATVPDDGTSRWPDPATVLLTALGPGPRLWERGPGHPDALTVRLGSAHRSGGSGEPVTIDLRAAGSLGLAGPRARLARMARSLLAQLAALHAPGSLEIVLLAADRTRELPSRTAEWSWLGWLPHLRPGHGQDCRLLVAYDDEQAAARTEELIRRLDETHPPPSTRAPLGHATGTHTAPAPADAAPPDPADASPAADPEARTLLVVDGDPGSAELRTALSRLAAEGPDAGIHVMCLAETPAASPASPLDATLRAAYAVSPPFRECRTLALLSGAVATAVRLIHREPAAEGQ